MSKFTAKTRAKNLKFAVQDVLGATIKLSQAYEILAREDGYANWDTASASMAKDPTSNAAEPSAKISVIRSVSRGYARFEPFEFTGQSSRDLSLSTLSDGDLDPGIIILSGDGGIDHGDHLASLLENVCAEYDNPRILYMNPSRNDPMSITRLTPHDSEFFTLGYTELNDYPTAHEYITKAARLKADIVIFKEGLEIEALLAARELLSVGFPVVIGIAQSRTLERVEKTITHVLSSNPGHTITVAHIG